MRTFFSFRIFNMRFFVFKSVNLRISYLFITTALVTLLNLLSIETIEAIEVPHIGDETLAKVTPEERAKYGQLFLRYIHGQQQTVFDPIILNYLKYDLLPKLQKNHDDPIVPKLLLINSTEINAFAAPDNIMGINLGLFIHAHTESEFASVIAHELGHMKYDHFALKLQQGKNQLRNNVLLLIASILIASQTESSDAATAVNIAGQTLNADQQAEYSRHLEMEADYYALKLLADDDFDIHAMPSFFERLRQQYPISESAVTPSFVKTHPLTANRISYTQARASQHSAQRKSILEDKTDIDYALIRTRILCNTAQSTAQMYEYYLEKFNESNFTENIQTNKSSAIDSKERIISAYGALSCSTRARIRLDEGLRKYLLEEQSTRNNTIIRQTLLEHDIAMSKIAINEAGGSEKNLTVRNKTESLIKTSPVLNTEYDKALAIKHYHTALSTYTSDPTQTTQSSQHSQSSQPNEEYSRALNLLNEIKYELNIYPQFWQLKRENAYLRQDKVGHYLAEAEIAYLLNNLELSKEKFEEALKLSTHFSTQSQIKYRLQELAALEN